MIKKYWLLILFGLFALNAHAQSKDDEARVLFQRAQDKYDEAVNYNKGLIIDNQKPMLKDYQDVQALLSKASDLVGRNPKICYLWIKTLNEGIKNGAFIKEEGSYQFMMGLLNQLFSQINKDTYPPEKYSEMVGIKLDVQDILNTYAAARGQAEKKQRDSAIWLASFKTRSAKFLRDTFDVYMQRFVTESNQMNDYSKPFYRKYIKKMAVIHHMEYNADTKEIIAYATNGDNETTPYCCPESIYVLAHVNANEAVVNGEALWVYYFSFPNPVNNKTGVLINNDKLNMWFGSKTGNLSLKVPHCIYDLAHIMDSGGWNNYFANKTYAQVKAEQQEANPLTQLYKDESEEGRAFLMANAAKSDITTLPNGVQYKIEIKGTGPLPTAGQNMTMSYTCALTNGKVCDIQKAAELPVGIHKIIKGLDESLMLMPVGTTCKLYVPGQLGYGSSPTGGPYGTIPGNSVLIYTVEVLGVK